MKSSFLLLIFTLLISACIGKNSVAIKAKSTKASTTSKSTSITVTSVKILNNQFILTGSNLDSATSVVIKESGTTNTLSIESQTSTSLTANGVAKLTLAAGKVFEFIVSSASASATFTVDFSLCSSTLGGKYLDCTTTPNDKEVLSYDANSGKWKPRSMNGISYQGVWDATGSLPSTTTEGDYYIVSVASGSYAVGDWIVYNGSAFEKISNSNAIVSIFGRTGAVTASEGDYVLNKMGDVDFTATPTTNQFLQFNGTNWVGATLSSVETDPNVKTFAKTTLPTCGSSEVLKGDGTTLSCVTVSSGSSFSGTASRAMTTDGSGALAVSAVTSTELGYVSGVTSAIQTQFNAFQAFAKTPIPTCNAGEVLKGNGTTFSCVTDNTGSGSFSGTASRAVVTDGTGVLASSAVTSTEVGYLSGVTSSIQTQFTNVAATAAAINTTSTSLTSGNIFVGSAGNVATSVTMSGDATMANTGALTIAANSVALSTDTTGNYVLNLTASNGLQATAAAGEGTTPNLVLGGTLTGATTFTQGTNNVLFDLTSTGIFSVLSGANGLSVSNLGVTTLSSAVLTTADINGGTLDDVTIGATTRAPGSFTTIAGTSAAIAGTASVGTLVTSNILGGTTTTSGLNLKTTSGVGTTTADMHFLVGNNGGTEAMTILNNGNVGIGNPTPSQKFSVAGVVESSTGGFKFPDGTTQTSASSTGGILQDVYITRSDSVTFAGVVIPNDDTIPQSSEGASILTQSITPLSTSSTLEIEGEIFFGEDSNTSNSLVVAVFEPTPSSDAISVSYGPEFNGSNAINCGTRKFFAKVANSATAARTFMINAAMIDSTTIRLNGCAGSRYFGGIASSWMRIREVSPSGNAAAGGITGTGTTNYIPKFNSSSVVTNSLIYDNGTNIGIGNTSPTVKLDVTGGVRAGSSTDVTTCGSGAANGEGTQRYNYTSHAMEYCDGTSWISMGGKAVAKAWVNFDGSGPTIRSSYGISGIVRDSLGHWTVTLSSAMTDTNYVIVGSASYDGNSFAISPISGTQTTTAFGIRSVKYDISNYADNPVINIAVFGN